MDASVICGNIARMKKAATVIATLALAACQPQDPTGSPAPPPADAPLVTPTAQGQVSDFSQPITALGTEPFWSLSLDGTTFRLTGLDRPELVATAPGAAIQSGRAVWIARAADGRQLTVTIYVSECSDGMSDRRYPMTAEVVLLNETLRGCAIRTAEMPRGEPGT